MADTSSKPALDLEGYKGASRFQEVGVARLESGEGFPVQTTLDRIACQREQKTGRSPVDQMLGGFRSHLIQDAIVTL